MMVHNSSDPDIPLWVLSGVLSFLFGIFLTLGLSVVFPT